MMKALTACISLMIFLTALTASASSISTAPSTLYPYQSGFEMQDDFLSGTVGSGSMGTLGWTTAGTITVQSSEANRPGIYRVDTSAVSATQARLSLPTAVSIDPALPHAVMWAVRLNTNDANTTLRIGTQNATNANPPAQGIFLEKLDADTNWFCVTRAASVQTRTDSTIAITTNFVTVKYTRDSSGVQFSIDNVNVCSLMTTNIPTTFVVPEVFIINSAAAAKTVDIDYFETRVSGMVR